MAYKSDFIEYMIKQKALKFGEFTTKSGRQSPYFINTGEFRTGSQISRLGDFYADCIVDQMDNGRIPKDINVLFGPAYKGIPLAVSTSIALSSKHGVDIGYCFNRKEAKDHGEGGNFVGAKLTDGDKLLILDDVITAGTAIREVLPIVKAAADVNICGMFISVDRMERGQGELSAVAEVTKEFEIPVFPIVNVLEIIEILEGREISGEVVLSPERKGAMNAYLEQYGATNA